MIARCRLMQGEVMVRPSVPHSRAPAGGFRLTKQTHWEGLPMTTRLTRRDFGLASLAAVATPALIRSARADEPLRLRCSLDTAPSHLRNVSMKDYLGKVEAASHGKIKTEF